MNPQAWSVYQDLCRAGLDVRAEGDTLVLKPAHLLTEDLRARARDTKPALLDLLRGDYWHERSDRERHATNESDHRRVYSPSDEPLAEPDTVDEAATDLLILSYATGRRARMLRALGECPAALAKQIRRNLYPVVEAVGAVEEAEP